MTTDAPTSFPDTRARFAELAERWAGLADALPGPAWSAPSPCAGWTALDVQEHVIDTQRSFLADRGVPVAVADDAFPAGSWRAHAAAVTVALAPEGVAEQDFDGFFGPTTVGETLATFYGFDMIVHRWDVAHAAGLRETWTEVEMDHVEASMDGFGEHMYADGICRPAVELSEPVSRQEQLLARSGRDPRV